MSNTANDLARVVGLKLGIIDAVTDLTADMLTDLTTWSRQKHAELVRDQVCYWDYDDIPDEVFQPLALYLASCFGKDFGKVVRDEPLSESQTREARLEALRTAAKPRYTGVKLKSDYPVASRSRFNFTTGT